MKKLILAASLCVIGFVVAPVASASAATEFVGSCTINGTASFGKPLSTKEPVANTYAFESGAGTECSGVIVEGAAETQVKGKAKAHVAGAGLLSCASSTSGTTAGSGYVEAPEGSGKKASFTGFNFVAAGTDVTFGIAGLEGSAASGSASFAKDTEAVKQCGGLGEGPSALQFEAVAVGKLG